MASDHTIESDRLEGELLILREKVKDSITEMRLGRRQRLRIKLLKADPTRKKFWRFLKSQIKAASSITALKDKKNQMVFEQSEIEEAVLEHFEEIFQGQRHPVYVQHAPVDHVQLCMEELDQLLDQESINYQPDQFQAEVCAPYSYLELDKMLQNLPNGKLSGYDRISNEMLKHASVKFRHYLLKFLSRLS